MKINFQHKLFKKKKSSQTIVNITTNGSDKTIRHEFELTQTLKAQVTPIHISGQQNNEEQEDGRKNYSNQAQSCGARHVVNMLGKFNSHHILYLAKTDIKTFLFLETKYHLEK